MTLRAAKRSLRPRLHHSREMPTTELPAPPESALNSPLDLLKWLSKRSAGAAFFSTMLAPTGDHLEAVAAKYDVDTLLGKWRALSHTAIRHGEVGTQPCVAFKFVTKGFTPTAKTKVQVILFEGKCGKHEHTFMEVLRTISQPKCEVLNEALMTLNGTASIVHEVRLPGAANMPVSTTAVVAVPLIAQTLNSLAPGVYLLCAYNKMGLCRQAYTAQYSGRLQLICDDGCDEQQAAEHAHDIVTCSIVAAQRCSRVVRSIDPTALLLAFHASHTTAEAARCCGRRGVACGTSEWRSTSQSGSGRDGAFEALLASGVRDVVVVGAPHLGWATGATRLN